MKIEAKSRALDKIYKRRDRYEIPDWQREEVWPVAKKQELIDSILRGWKLPKFYFFKISDDPEEFEVVDGQQRLATIFDFFDNQLALTFTAAKMYGGKFYKELSEAYSDSFDDFEIEYDEIIEATEEEIKEFFQRLQQGLPLTSSEKLNAVHSSLQKFCKDLAKHKFFKNRINIVDKRYSHFDIASKVATLEIDGLGAGLRFDDLRSVFITQKNFSANSAVAKRLKSTLGYLDRAFPSKSPELRNRSFVQSVITLAARIVATGHGAGTEKNFGAFIKRFFEELSAQVELGLEATDKDYISFQRSVNANVRGGAIERHRILLRKLFSQGPSFSALFAPDEIEESGVAAEAKRLSEAIKILIEKVNSNHAAKYGKDLIKPTNKTATAIGRLGAPVKNHDDYVKLISDLYFLFWEGTGERIKGKEPASFLDINVLRTDMQHDLDHGKASKSAKQRKLASNTFRKYSSATTPNTAAPERFPIFQVAILTVLEKELRVLSN